MSHLNVGSADYEVCDATARSAGFVDTVNLKDGAVTSGKLASGAVTSGKISDGAVDNGKLASNAVTSGKISNGSVNTVKIADGAVTTVKIADANVTTAKVADGNVTTAKIADENVTTAKIANSNVTTAKIADDAVTSGKIADDAVVETKIANNAVTVGKLPALNNTQSQIAAMFLKSMVGRQTSLDFAHISDDERVNVRVDIVSASLTTNPFGAEGFVLTFFWDGSGIYDTQLFLPVNTAYKPQFRIHRPDGWTNPVEFLVERQSTGTATKNTTNAYGNEPTYVKMGKIANVSLFNVGVAVSGINVPLATGLPKPVETQYITIPAQGSNSDYPLVLKIDTTGTLYTANAWFKQNAGYHGQITYICSE